MFDKYKNEEGFLEVGNGHQIWYGDYGTIGSPVCIEIHGGPGGSTKYSKLSEYDLDSCRVILFDQRGCGNSHPSGNIMNNTLKQTIEDIERLRKTLNIDKWYVIGGSWGSTVALTYAQNYPQNILGMVLYSIFLGRRKDINWLDMGGARIIFPEVWDNFSNFLKKENISEQNYLDVFSEKIINGDIDTQKKYTAVHKNWERLISTLDHLGSCLKMEDVKDEDILSSKIYLHYAKNKFFLKENQILENMKTIEHIPTLILHGRYDIVCPVEQAYLVHKSLKKSSLEVFNQSGHRLEVDAKIIRKYFKKLIIQK